MNWDALKKLFGGGNAVTGAGSGAFMPQGQMGPQPDSWEQLAAHQGAIDRQMSQGQMLQGMAQQMGQSGAVGWLPLLGQLLPQLAGQSIERKAGEKASDLAARQFRLQNEDAAKKAEQEMRAEEAKYRRDLERRRGEAGDPLLNPQKRRDPIKIGNQLVQYNDDGTVQKLYEAPRAPQQGRAPSALAERIAFAEAHGATPEQIQAMVIGGGGAGQAVPSGYRANPDGSLAPIPGGPADPSVKGSAIGQEAQNKIALINNALANAREYQKRVVRPDGSFADIESMSGDTPGLLKAAIQDQLYVKSGASAPEGEVAKWEGIYGPGTFERDSTASAKVGKLIADLERQREGILGGGNAQQAGAPRSASARPPAAPASGPQPGEIQDGYRFLGGNPADPNAWEPAQ